MWTFKIGLIDDVVSNQNTVPAWVSGYETTSYLGIVLVWLQQTRKSTWRRYLQKFLQKDLCQFAVDQFCTIDKSTPELIQMMQKSINECCCTFPFLIKNIICIGNDWTFSSTKASRGSCIIQSKSIQVKHNPNLKWSGCSESWSSLVKENKGQCLSSSNKLPNA